MSAMIPSELREPPPAGHPPAINLVPHAVAALAQELVADHAHVASLFRRSEQRTWALASLHGHVLELERTAMEPMALAFTQRVPGGDVQAMQQFISQGAWDDDAVLERHQALVADPRGAAATGVLILDGGAVPKPGPPSVGGARPWGGALGNVAQCQARVGACSARKHGDTLVDRRLSLPESWFTAAYQARRAQGGVPDDVPCHMRPEVAGAIFARLVQRGALPVGWVLWDEQVGNHPTLLDQIAAATRGSLAEGPHKPRGGRQRPPPSVPAARGKRGRRPRRARLRPEAPAPPRVAELAAEVPPRAWQRYQMTEGATGPLVAEFAVLRVVPGRDGLPGQASWVVLRRRLGEQPDVTTSLANAPAVTPRRTVVAPRGMRWCGERSILERTRDCGLDHYEGRGGRGWHHPRTMRLLAQHVLVRQRRRLGETSSRLDRAAGAGGVPDGAAAARPRRRNSDCAHSVHPRAERCGLSLPPTSDRASARRFVTN